MAATPQQMNLVMCEIDETLPKKIKEIKFRRSTDRAALILKVVKKDEKIVLEEELQACTTEEVQEELPDTQPRYLIYSYSVKQKDGRKYYPLMLFYYKPNGCPNQLLMRYAGSIKMVQQLLDNDRTYNLDDKEKFTDKWIHEQLKEEYHGE